MMLDAAATAGPYDVAAAQHAHVMYSLIGKKLEDEKQRKREGSIGMALDMLRQNPHLLRASWPGLRYLVSGQVSVPTPTTSVDAAAAAAALAAPAPAATTERPTAAAVVTFAMDVRNPGSPPPAGAAAAGTAAAGTAAAGNDGLLPLPPPPSAGGGAARTNGAVVAPIPLPPLPSETTSNGAAGAAANGSRPPVNTSGGASGASTQRAAGDAELSRDSAVAVPDPGSFPNPDLDSVPVPVAVVGVNSDGDVGGTGGIGRSRNGGMQAGNNAAAAVSTGLGGGGQPAATRSGRGCLRWGCCWGLGRSRVQAIGGQDAGAAAGVAASDTKSRSGSSSIGSVNFSAGERQRSKSLQEEIQQMETEMVHVRRTLLKALVVYDWLREVSLPEKPGASFAPTTSHGAARRQLHALRQSGARKIINPRTLLDKMLKVYGSLSDLDIPALATTFQEAVWECVGLPGSDDTIEKEMLASIFTHEVDRQIAWDALDGDKDGKLTRDNVRSAVISFLQQQRSMALTVRAVRRLTSSLQSSLIAIINGIFLVPVYLSILDVARFFSSGGGSKTSLDIFSVYVLVVSLIFSEQIKHVLLGCVLILTQQPFDVGEELVIEEAPGWRVMGVVQDFNIFYLRVKKSADGELVTLPLNKLSSNRFTNLTRSDWKIEQNYFAVDASTPPSVLEEMQQAAMDVITRTKSEYDEMYGFLAVYHGFERPNKVIIRTFHRYKFNLSAAHKRIANARHGIMSAVREVFHKHGIEFTEMRMHLPLPPHLGGGAGVAAAGYGGLGAPPGPASPAALSDALGAGSAAAAAWAVAGGGGRRGFGTLGGGRA
ncbi:hypothetical protein VOLCADRAFT_96527 [Volvox carteri f. nagariensis]|uniref:EF-hand domain-containing protein n=1 Tax=Volvox carteri f. nagariensis TaxID=3068 RepID=D8UAC3_VOLCA|nr:uncharacterized protein VOLCADRAFT_96527 [Volvox carteri f. nagariensis]EFJ43291.1 hypothetical protein VOLCADRAFT_96527 [Volvox carteri f. nagariensis]|eukprot:XP_002955651.1 hypothetical protein VOLCADRAFT_96527 [Volvox carteri f. nagariensis]